MIVISVTKNGNKIANKLQSIFPNLKIVTREDVVEVGLKNITKTAMKEYKTIIFIASTGIAVRAIAPWVRDKRTDPAVLVIDSEATYVISLLSGHLGGANKVAEYIGKSLELTPIITTATDQLGIISPDIISLEHNLEIEDMKKCKQISVHLIEGEQVGFLDEDNIIPIPKGYVKPNKETKYQVIVSNKAHLNNANLQLIRKNIVLGIGCKKNVSEHIMRDYILEQLEKINIHPMAVERIVSIDIKKEEKCIVELAKYLKVPFDTYSKDKINNVNYKFDGSDFVEKSVGVRGVCEPCVVLAGAKIIKEKSKHNGITLCIGVIPL